ncbi:Post-GPI attachment to proteins factor 2-like [Lamellibrachia satsuma]|nr:Post-GPI attachment to proteins factor 2-like [Lamellibrachia satsuma]
MGVERKDKEEKIRKVLFQLPLQTFAHVIVSVPALSLVLCFVTSVIFQFDQVNETVCHVQNLVPSISAITGVSPQRYLWRIVMALQCTPRITVGFMYYNYWMGLVQTNNVAEDNLPRYLTLTKVAFYLYLIENFSLIGTAYIANVDNYPIHEKLFVAFMISSLFYQLITIMLFRWSHPQPMTSEDAYSYKWKKRCFISILTFTAGLLFFFYRHRFHCDPKAFSIFSVCEYGIALMNMAFHYTGATDFRGSYWYVASPGDCIQETSNNHNDKKVI